MPKMARNIRPTGRQRDVWQNFPTPFLQRLTNYSSARSTAPLPMLLLTTLHDFCMSNLL